MDPCIPIAAVILWLTWRGMAALRRAIEPRCPDCGGHRWTQDPRGGLSCAACADASPAPIPFPEPSPVLELDLELPVEMGRVA